MKKSLLQPRADTSKPNTGFERDMTQTCDFVRCIQQELDALYRTAYYLTKNRMLAEDIVQETVMKAIKKQSTFQTDRQFRPWIFAVLRNTVRDYFRKQQNKPDTFSLENHPTVHSNTPTPDQHVFSQVLDEEIELALNELSEDMRLAVLLADVEGFSYKELAKTLNWPLGTVMSRLSRGRKKLRQKLKTYAQSRGYA